MQLLLIDRNENLLRPFRNFDGRFFAGAIGGFRLVRFVCASMLVPATVPTAIPVSGRRGRGARCQRQTCGEGERGHAAADAAVPPTLPLVASRTRDAQIVPPPRWNRFEPSANSSKRDQLSPSRECDAAVANCGKTSILKTQRNATACRRYLQRIRYKIMHSALVCLPCAKLRTDCQHCDLISAARQMCPPKADRNADARHDHRA